MAELTRREAIQAGAAAGVAMTSAAAFGRASGQGDRFRLKYAPHFGMFQNHAGDDPVDQLKFAADEGFHAWEDNGMKGRSVADQERISKAMRELGMTMGVFVVNGDTAWSPTLTTGKADAVAKFLQECRDSVEVAKRVHAKWMTVVPGTIEPRLEPGYQSANVVEALRRASAVFEPHGLVMVLEPLNYRDHPNLFLNKISQGYQVCRAVNSPACKILFDLYHQQVQEGNLIPNIDLGWSEIGYFQIGDNPGRNEPTTGEVNFRNVFGHLASKGYEGLLGMEHGNRFPGKEGERKLIDAYRACDAF
ncbi:MAG: TIM barrel protein [Fimbriimonadaceae bacterium]|nr:TIM barrel protein [Fimbriimonadaceae bacterium]